MHRPAPALRPRLLGAAVGVAVLTGALVGCTGGGEAVTVTTTPEATVSSPTPERSVTSSSPTTGPATPSGRAAEDLPLFRTVTETIYSSADRASGRAYIDGLVVAGFEKTAMQVTSDTTTLGDAAESIQFSVLLADGQCLVGQVGPATGTAVTAVLPAVGDGVCLLGRTRPIDW